MLLRNNYRLLIFLLLFTQSIFAQSWEDVGGGTNNSSHALLTWNGYLVNLGSFNNPCTRTALWDGTSWGCLGSGPMGQVARDGVVWNGKLVVVGDFWNTQQPCVGCNGVAMWDEVNQIWTPLGNGVNNDVLCCTIYNGDLIIGGDFTQASGVPSSRVVRYNELTDTWESMGAVSDFDNDVRCMTVFDGELWVGGDFNNVGGNSPSDGVVKWDETAGQWVGGNSGVDLVGGVNETIRVLYVNPNDGNLYMGGHFTELHDGDAAAPDPNMSGIAMYDGSNWYPLGTGLNDYVRAIHEYNGNLIAGGYFTNAGGTPAQKIAKWNGSTWSAMGAGFDASGIDEYVKSATVWNGIFFAGGAYTQAEGGPMNFIAQWYEAPSSAPVAEINVSSSEVCTGECIYFEDQSTGNPTSWNWTFNGANTTSSLLQHPGNVCYTSPGSYVVSLEACNSNGCTTSQYTITVGEAPSVLASDVNSCDGQNVSLTAIPSISGGIFEWVTTNETTATINVNPTVTTDYVVQYSLNGCMASDVATVTVGSTPTLTVLDQAICTGQTAVLTAVPDIGGGVFNWIATNESTSSIAVSPSVSSNYIVEYTLNGCTGTASGLVEVYQNYNVNEVIQLCPNSFYTYPDGVTESISGPTVHTSSLLSQFGCDSIIVSNLSVYPEYSTTIQEIICSGSDYIYPDGTISSNIITSESHTSFLSTQHGCDSVVVIELSVVTSIQVSESFNICAGSDYVYPDGTAISGITVNQSHVSNLITSAGCDSIVTTSLIVLAIPSDQVNVVSSTLTSLENGASYQWLDCADMSEISGETAQSFTPISSGIYAVEVTDINGCSVSSNCLEIDILSLNETDEWSLSIFPNPTFEDITIATNIASVDLDYKLYDFNGKELRSGRVQSGGKLSLRELTQGIYVLKLENRSFRITKL